MVVFIFTSLNEAIIEYFIGGLKSLKPYLPLISLSSAILLTFGFQVSLFNIFFNIPLRAPFIEFLMSAFIIARLSNFLNDFVRKFLGSK